MLGEGMDAWADEVHSERGASQLWQLEGQASARPKPRLGVPVLMNRRRQNPAAWAGRGDGEAAALPGTWGSPGGGLSPPPGWPAPAVETEILNTLLQERWGEQRRGKEPGPADTPSWPAQDRLGPAGPLRSCGNRCPSGGQNESRAAGTGCCCAHGV